MPVTHGIRPSALLGVGAPTRTATVRTHVAAGAPPPVVVAPVEAPTVEMIRGDKRAHETVR